MNKAYLITDPTNVFYLSEFKSSSGFMLLFGGKKYLFIDKRYLNEAEKNKGIIVIESDKNQENFQELCLKLKIKKIFFESHHLTIDKFEKLKKILKKISLKKILEKEKIIHLREIKSVQEIKKIKKAQKIIKKIVNKVFNELKEGDSEKKVAIKIQELAVKYGAEETSFEPIVAFGPNSAIPHHRSDYTPYKKNQIVLIDAGVKFQNYCSDLTRTFLPKAADLEMKKAYALVKKAQELAVLEINKNKTSLKNIEKKVRNFFKKNEKEEFFTHSLGHGVGLEIHEEPRFSLISESKFKENQIFSIEPGLYFPQKFGIRIEDLFLLTKDKLEKL